jgi:ABC-type protease/lipase transport system fused ATPase/permease subunit
MTSVLPPPALTRRAPKPAAVSIVPVAPLVALFIVSLMSNLLMLVGPLFMLQVYDRVLASQSLPTLTVLTILVCALYGFYAFIEAVRARMATRFGIERSLGQRLLAAAVVPLRSMAMCCVSLSTAVVQWTGRHGTVLISW